MPSANTRRISASWRADLTRLADQALQSLDHVRGAVYRPQASRLEQVAEAVARFKTQAGERISALSPSEKKLAKPVRISIAKKLSALAKIATSEDYRAGYTAIKAYHASVFGGGRRGASRKLAAKVLGHDPEKSWREHEETYNKQWSIAVAALEDTLQELQRVESTAQMVSAGPRKQPPPSGLGELAAVHEEVKEARKAGLIPPGPAVSQAEVSAIVGGVLKHQAAVLEQDASRAGSTEVAAEPRSLLDEGQTTQQSAKPKKEVDKLAASTTAPEDHKVEWSAPMTKADIARRVTRKEKARARDIEPLLDRWGWEHIKGRMCRVRLDMMDKATRAKLEGRV